jgi:hypothetical protein
MKWLEKSKKLGNHMILVYESHIKKLIYRWLWSQNVLYSHIFFKFVLKDLLQFN